MRIARPLLAALLLCSAAALAFADDGRIAVGAPRSESRAGFMAGLAARIRMLIGGEPSAGGLIALCAAAAAYGVAHALGPGHQKTLVSGYILTEGGGLGRVMAAAAIAAASHAASVVVLFGGLALLGGGLGAARGEAGRMIATKASAALLVLLSARNLYRRVAAARERRTEHGTSCACSACAPARPERKSGIALLLAGSLAPCPGAAFFLLLGFSAGEPAAGVLAVVAVSAGMWLTLTAVGAAALLVRAAGDARAERAGGRTELAVRAAFEIGGALMVLAFALLLLF